MERELFMKMTNYTVYLNSLFWTGCVGGLTAEFKRLDGVTEVEFVGEKTAFILRSDFSIPEYQKRFTEIIENWEHYNYSVDRVDVQFDE